MSNRDLDKLAEQAREAARQGRMQDAQQRMAELERMLDRLRNARAEHGREGENPSRRSASAGGSRWARCRTSSGGRAACWITRRARTDDSMRFRRRAARCRSRRIDDAQRDADQRVQQALRRALGELMQQFGDLTGKVPPSLGEADTAMREAGRQLGQGDDAGAE